MNQPQNNAQNEEIVVEGRRMSIEEYLDQDERKDLLRLLTAGSVDDGKSTLIGRLLFDSKKLYEDQLSALERDSRRVGNAGAGKIDYAQFLHDASEILYTERSSGHFCTEGQTVADDLVVFKIPPVKPPVTVPVI